ncbi:DUF1054 domain-containing protein [Enterococcus sp. AD013-P3]|uniref:DUF1054 domain-containing protein n=1 Tax=Enterococcus sp. AD013-P3 TaxID=3411036 RepID=UPI003B93ECE3
MFEESSFDVFQVPGLEARMAAIRSEIQPVFQQIGEALVRELETALDRTFYLHIAQHRRRSVHPPENTWAAVGEGKRGYKMAPHFQIGIWPEYVFMWLSIIDQPKGQKSYAETLLAALPEIEALPQDFVINKDHTTAPCFPLSEAKPALERLASVKKSEFQLGRVIPRESTLWQNPENAREDILATYRQLLPFYELLTKKS